MKKLESNERANHLIYSIVKKFSHTNLSEQASVQSFHTKVARVNISGLFDQETKEV
jgi:hypothetical protein